MTAYTPTPADTFRSILLSQPPAAMAWVRGNSQFPSVSGLVKFYRTPFGGVLTEAEFFGLPGVSVPGSSGFFAMHIHENGDCSGDFSHTGGHYNPEAAAHPDHAGDLPPLLSAQGYAWTAFYDKRFSIEDIVNRSLIVHLDRDDFTSQPSGDPGPAAACGVIRGQPA